MTQNLANYADADHPDWNVRRGMHARTILQEAPDVVALQEVRFDPTQPSTAATGQDMAEQVLALLAAADPATWGQAALVTEAGMWYPVQPDGEPAPRFPSVRPPQSREGLSILSRLPVAEAGCRFLTPTPPAQDANRRITQYARVLGDRGPFVVFNAHFTLSPGGLQGNVDETLALMGLADDAPHALLGDLNATPDAAPLQALARAGLADAWPLLHPDDPGATFDLTAPGGPTRRIDYAWLSPGLGAALNDARLVSTAPSGQVHASDHAGLVLELDA